jgi:thiol-disulfide isomerase/thioredoxin
MTHPIRSLLRPTIYLGGALIVGFLLISLFPRWRGALEKPSPLVGQPAPQFELPLYSGGNVSLADLRGKVVVLDFWATWCRPCVESMPRVEAIAAKHADRGVVLYAINVDDPPETIAKFLESHPVRAPIALGSQDVSRDYEVRYIPQVVVIDRKGVVRALRTPSPMELERWLNGAIESALK